MLDEPHDLLDESDSEPPSKEIIQVVGKLATKSNVQCDQSKKGGQACEQISTLVRGVPQTVRHSGRSPVVTRN